MTPSVAVYEDMRDVFCEYTYPCDPRSLTVSVSVLSLVGVATMDGSAYIGYMYHVTIS